MADRIAVYAGSFDPPTNGHLAVVQRGRELFDTLIVAIAHNPAKAPLFAPGERAAMLTDAIGSGKTVLVDSFTTSQATVDYARAKGARWLLRGFRSATDVEYERQMEWFNSQFEPSITTVFIGAPADVAHLSSSAVRGLLGLDGWEDKVRPFVPANVFAALQRKVAGDQNHGRCV